MFRALAANLVAHERIETTEAKAKELRRVAERLVTRAKRLGPISYTPHDKLKPEERVKRLAAQKQIGRFLRRFGTVQDDGEVRKVDLIEKVFIDLAKRYKDRPGGYTRILKLGPRRGDNAPMTIIEFVDRADQADQAATPPKAEAKAEKTEKADAKKADAEAAPKKTEAKKPEAKAEKAEPKKAEAKAEPKKAEAKAEPKKAESAKPAEKKPEAKKAEAKKSDDEKK